MYQGEAGFGEFFKWVLLWEYSRFNPLLGRGAIAVVLNVRLGDPPRVLYGVPGSPQKNGE